MDAQFPAQVDFGDWMEIGVLLLVAAASVLAPIVKKIIQALGPKESGKEVKDILVEVEEELDEAPLPAPPARRAPPGYPVARPRPPARASSGQPPMAKPMVPPPSRRDAVAEIRETRPIEPTTLPPSSPPGPRRSARTPPTRPVPPAARSFREERLVHVAKKQRPESQAPKKRMERPLRERDLGDLKPSHKPVAPGAGRERDSAIGHPSRAELRRAILMREILGPPVALRETDDAFQLR